jgi:hypothetical protein
VSLLSLESLKTPQEKHKDSWSRQLVEFLSQLANAALRKPFETREANQVYPINSKPDESINEKGSSFCQAPKREEHKISTSQF